MNLLFALFALMPKDLSSSEVAFLGLQSNPLIRRSQLIASPTVQKLLSLTQQQKAEVELLRLKVREDVARGALRPETKLVVNASRFELAFDENDRVVAEILTSDQLRVVGCLQLQSLGPFAPFRLKSLGRVVGVTDEQFAELERKTRERTGNHGVLQPQDIAKGGSGGSVLDPIALLTEEQKAKLDLVVGRRYDLAPIISECRRLWRPRLGESPAAQSALGDFMTPVSFLFVDEFLALLECSPDQRKKLVEFVKGEREHCAAETAKLREASKDENEMNTADQRKERRTRAWKGIQGALNEGQIRRLNEAWLQVRGYNELFSTSETAKLLRITSEQKQRIADHMKNQGPKGVTAKMEETLSIDQKREFAKMQGTPIPRAVLLRLRSVRGRAHADEYGIPRIGIGAE